MKVVCDTNVFVSGILFGGPPREIMRLASRGHVVDFVSAPILRELEEVLSRPEFKLTPGQILGIIGLARETFDLVEPDLSVEVVKDDPDDDRILEAAVCAGANCIISGDRHLLELGTWQDIRIVKASAFVEHVMLEVRPGSGLDASGRSG